ncbi:hypothetical protein [Anaerosinus massiliensis]|uniref:hypothetical protein n=1 Tax=Massilibacillus massiliensis TaxID=1806837 RepID=UPI000DA63718|nr:hypothetical protein [Massilibacillus massiliensis]
MIQQCLKFTSWSLFNPICIFCSFAMTNYLGMFRSVETNSVSFSREFFSVYVFIGMIALLVQIIFAYAISRILSSRVTPSKVLEAFFVAQYPFIVMILLEPIIFSTIEGNIMGLICIPIFLLLTILSGPFSLRIYYIKITKSIASGEEREGGMKGIVFALVVALIFSLFSIYRFGFNTHLVNYMTWRPDIPQYAISQAMKSLKNREPDAFAQYVDLDSFYQSEDAEILKAELLNAVAEGRFFDHGEERIRVGEWVMAKLEAKRGVGSFPQLPIVDSFIFSNEGNLLKATAEFYSDANGHVLQVPFELHEKNGKYRIVCGADFNAVIDKIQKYRKALDAFPDLANQEGIQSILTIKVTNFLAIVPEDGAVENSNWVVRDGKAKSTSFYLPVKITAAVGNNTNEELRAIDVAVVYRDKQTNQVIYVDSISASIKKDPVKSQEIRHVTFEDSVNPVLAVAIKSGKAKVAEVYPIKVFYDGGRALELLKVQIPKL